ncbi:MAG: endolytic transglycosylase MltG [Actinobacteria bacterium]|nr:endolytic transglycosylase MltG [Actinomycetota bacterium]
MTLLDDPAPPTRRARRGDRRRNARVLIGVLGSLALVGLVALGWFWYQLDPPGAAGDRVTLEVEDGWGVDRIASELADRGVIGSPLAFRAYARLTGAGPFRAGRYELREDMGVRPAIGALEAAPAQTYAKLALPPGLTLDMIAARVGALPGLDAARFSEVARSGTIRSEFQPADVSSLEGLTWPDTYYVSEHEDETDVLRTLVRTFDEKATALGLGSAPDPYHVVVVASLVQTEAKLDEDRPLIAAVVENRLRDDMPLQIDATVLYARGTREGALTDADFALDSPYNTYRVKGLPPTPISTVSAASLSAALAPASVPYEYYVLIDESGKHRFAQTYAEHERNVAEARAKGLLG